MDNRILAIDTATPACSVALFEDRELIAKDYQEIGRGHAEKLVPMIAKLPEKGRAGKIVVNCGPGSFTGVRIGISAAKALALAWKADLLGYQCLHLVAAQALSNLDVAKPICVAMTGGHGELFVQNFSQEGSPIDTLESLEPTLTLDKAKSNLIAGSGIKDLSKLMEGRFETTYFLPDAAFTGLLKAEQMILKVSPIYGREPDAVMSRMQ